MPCTPILACLVSSWRAQGEWWALLIVYSRTDLFVTFTVLQTQKCNPASAGL